MILNMEYRRYQKLELIGGGIIALIFVAVMLACLAYLLGLAVDLIPTSFHASCVNVPGGDECHITIK